MTDVAEATEPKHKIHPGLEEFAQPIESLKLHPDNPRIGNVDAIAESLDENQQMKPIVARQDGTIVAGNHTFQAAKKLGWTHVAALLLEMTEEQEKKYLLADNRVSDLAEYDLEVLQPMLAEMAEAGNLQGTGFTADDVEDMTAELGKIATNAVPDGAEHVEGADETAARYPSAANEGGQPKVPMKEVLLVYPNEQFDEFKENIDKLKSEWGVDGTRDIVAEAVKRAAANPSGS